MGEMKNPTITISNFGPIKRARIELKPLNIFIGGHNTGKSYAAQMVYCIARALRGDYRRIRKIEEKIGGPNQAEIKAMTRELKALEGLGRRGAEIKFREIGKNLQKNGEKWWVVWEQLCMSDIASSLSQYFMVEDVGDLVRFDGESVKCGIVFRAVGENGARVRIRIGKKAKKISVNVEAPSIQALSIRLRRSPWGLDYDTFEGELFQAWRRLWKGIADHDPYYLPAARSGILQLWTMLQVFLVDILPEKMGLGGFVRDFFTNTARSGMAFGGDDRGRKEIKQALEVLEGEILGGEIAYRGERLRPSTIDYRFGKGASISIQRASSMVAELAPLDLWIKRLLEKGDLLIIEEPEAHLHPSSQIQIARLIARLVNSGVRIICTTHSQLLVNRISNLMLASEAQESVRKELGLKEADVIKEEDLAVYQFIGTDSGSVVKKLRMIRKFGIPEDEFLGEYEKISRESYKVSS
ncbi:AAA family ATPase [Candidatus Bathyarchaeota archaeon]|nr:AAA family ATPase [Candidatus Bathyarchaeota archaeon]